MQVHDLEEKLRGYMQAAGKLVHMMDNLAGSADKVCFTSGLADRKDSIDCQPVKNIVDGFKERSERVRSEINLIDEELKALLDHVEERNKAGAAYERQRSKAEKLEAKNDSAASVARDEAERMSDSYHSTHSNTLRELEQWKSSAADRFEPVHEEVVHCIVLLFNTGTSSSSLSSSKAPKQQQQKQQQQTPVAAVDNYSTPKDSHSKAPSSMNDDLGPPPDVFAPEPISAKSVSTSLGKAIGQWDFNAETPEEVSFAAGDVINLLECEADDEWWKGETPDGRVGLFPAAYVAKQ